jgi:hypothetical protein
LEFALSSLATASDEQYESIPDDEIALLARKFWALHKFCKERRRTLRGCFECGDTTHFIADYPKRKKLDSSNKYDYTNKNDYNNKGDNKKKNCFRYKKTSQVKTPLAQKSMKRLSARKVTSPGYALWANLQGTPLTLM